MKTPPPDWNCQTLIFPGGKSIESIPKPLVRYYPHPEGKRRKVTIGITKYYGIGQHYHVSQRNAWSTFDAFIAEDRLTQWVESSLEHAEHIAAAGDRRQAVQTTEDDKRKAVHDANERRHLQAEAFDALNPSKRYRLLEEAKKLLPPGLQRNAGQVRIRAIALMAAGGITKGKDSRDKPF